MSTVTLSIGPKSYTVACADGQEAHIKALGAMIAEKYAQLGTARAPLEAQNLLFSALFLADELAEVRKKLGDVPAPAPVPDAAELDTLRAAVTKLEAELAAAKDAAAQPAVAPGAAPSDLFGGAPAVAAQDDALAERLEALAAQVEASAAALEAAAASA
jgi:cell division protein ZapA